MNKNKILYSLLLVAIVVGACTLLSSSAAEKNNENQEIMQDFFPQRIYSISIPLEYEFAGEIIDLRRHDLRARFDRELLAFTYMHSTTLLLIKRANLYFPIIEPILKANNVPVDFKYLAVIESSLNARAVSPANAVGIWQFLADTARELGLEVTDQVDERLHLEKSTAAAARFLRRSYEIYGDWITAAASYNAGRRRISEALRAQGQTNIFDTFVNDETSRYIFRLLAVKEIMSNPAKYGLHLRKEDFYHTVRTREVEVSGSIENWAEWARGHGISYIQLRHFNPWIRRGMRLDNRARKTYRVTIPYLEDLYFDPDKIIIHNPAWVN